MTSQDKEIIELHPENPDQGEIRYSYSSKPPQKSNPIDNFLMKILGIALGVGVFIFLIVFFVYVLIPLAVIVIFWMFLRSLFSKNQ